MLKCHQLLGQEISFHMYWLSNYNYAVFAIGLNHQNISFIVKHSQYCNIKQDWGNVFLLSFDKYAFHNTSLYLDDVSYYEMKIASESKFHQNPSSTS
jgi:hypothetical protein